MPRLLLLLPLCFLLGCSDISFYAQAMAGHMKLISAAKPISDLLNDGNTSPELRQHLEQATAIRDFASLELALPNNGSYRSYADLGRPFAVWNVFAAPEFSIEPQQWCMFIVGCVNYRGYYDKKDADELADKLKQSGADTFVGGVPAYSTLGHFNDPILNTFMRYGDQEVARTIFHELAHQVVFVEDDTAFNESFATAVENEGMQRWLTKTASPALRQEFEKRQKRAADFHHLLSGLREKLRAIYATSNSPNEMRRAKTEAIAEIQNEYAALKDSWGGYNGYDQWFNQPINNATLGSVNLYTQWLPAFKVLLEKEGGNLSSFYQKAATLAQLSKNERSDALKKLMPRT